MQKSGQLVGYIETCVFSLEDINLGGLMSTVCSVHVGGWAGVGARSAEGGRRPGRIRRRAARRPL